VGADKDVDGKGREQQCQVGIGEPEKRDGLLEVVSWRSLAACATNAAPRSAAATKKMRPVEATSASSRLMATTTTVSTRRRRVFAIPGNCLATAFGC
jgi:hypothetical protein